MLPFTTACAAVKVTVAGTTIDIGAVCFGDVAGVGCSAAGCDTSFNKCHCRKGHSAGMSLVRRLYIAGTHSKRKCAAPLAASSMSLTVVNLLNHHPPL